MLNILLIEALNIMMLLNSEVVALVNCTDSVQTADGTVQSRYVLYTSLQCPFCTYHLMVSTFSGKLDECGTHKAFEKTANSWSVTSS